MTRLCECGKAIRTPTQRTTRRGRKGWKWRPGHDMCRGCWGSALDRAKRGMRPHELVPELWEMGS